MPNQFDPLTVDILSLRPRLRRDLRIVRHVYGGHSCFVIDDPISGKVHRIGPAEYTLVSALNGKRSVADALSIVANRHGSDAVDSDQA